MEDLPLEHSNIITHEVEYSVVIPTYNSESFLADLVGEIVAYFSAKKESFEVICVNDCSTDGTWGVIKRLSSEFKEVRGMRLSRNFGQHNATCAGFSKTKGKYVITIDDDFEENPKDIELLIKNREASDAKVVYGHYENPERKFVRKLFKSIYEVVAKLIEGKSRVNGSSFRLIDGGLARQIAQEATFFVFIDEALLWYTENIAFQKVTHYPSRRGKSNYSIYELFKLTGEVVLYSSILPLKAVKYLGFTIASINFALGMYYLIKRVFFHISEKGYASLIISVLFSTGLIIFILGVIGEYLSKMFRIMNKRPVFSIEDEV